MPLLGLRAAGWIISCFDRQRDALKNTDDIVDGTVYVGAGDGKLYAFTSYGQLPD